jgi:hypothetical protein
MVPAESRYRLSDRSEADSRVDPETGPPLQAHPPIRTLAFTIAARTPTRSHAGLRGQFRIAGGGSRDFVSHLSERPPDRPWTNRDEQASNAG